MPTSLTHASSGVRSLCFLLAATLTGLVAALTACSSESKDAPAKGGTSAMDSETGGSSNSAGKATSDAGKSGNTGGASDDGAAGDTSSGAAPDDGGTAAAGASDGGSPSGGSSSGVGGSAGSGNGATLPGDDVWNCIEAGTSCICQNNGDPKSANSCTATYKCCFTIPLGTTTRCQCQDPYSSKCSDLASFNSGKVVDHCPP